jgi:hypothetical protein
MGRSHAATPGNEDVVEGLAEAARPAVEAGDASIGAELYLLQAAER